jgi:hypothetical protein
VSSLKIPQLSNAAAEKGKSLPIAIAQKLLSKIG